MERLALLPPPRARALLGAGAIASAAVAGLHLAVVAVGAEGYRVFGAGEEMVRLARTGSPIPALVTTAIAVAFAVAAVLALSAAGLFRLPLARALTWGVAAVYLSRGAALLAPLVGAGGGEDASFLAITSLVSLAIGIAHAAGLRLAAPHPAGG